MVLMVIGLVGRLWMRLGYVGSGAGSSVGESVGVNRHGREDENALHQGFSES